MLKLIKKYSSQVLSLDLRSLALYRIALGVFLLLDLWIRATEMTAFYTDSGVLPRGVFLSEFANRWNISIHLIGGTVGSQSVLFIINALLLLFFTIGWRTRLMTFLCWFFLISLQSRNTMILQGGDVLVRVLMFWALFLPLGAMYSVDASMDTAPEKKPKFILSAGTIALYIQFLIFYWFSVLNKSGKEWWPEGSAVYYALSVDHFATPIAHFILEHVPYWALRLMTFGTLIIETVGAGLILVTGQAGWARLGVVFLFVFLHMSFRSCLDVSIFPFISSIYMLAFIPSRFWDTLGERLRGKQQRLLIYYDGECRFCKKMVALFKTFFLLSCQVEEAQKYPKVHKEMERLNSWIVEDQHKVFHTHYDAVLLCVRESQIFAFLLPILRFGPLYRLGDRAYRYVARNRLASARWVKWVKWGPLTVKQGLISSLLSVFFICYVYAWNSGDMGYPIYVPRSWSFIASTLRIDQAWDMFSPYPMKNDGWIIIPGKLKNGRELDMLNGKRPVTYEKPPYFPALYGTHHWEKYTRNILQKSNEEHLLYWGKYICRMWNNKHEGDEQLSTFQIIYMRETTLPDYQKAEIVQDLMWSHNCFLKDPEPKS